MYCTYVISPILGMDIWIQPASGHTWSWTACLFKMWSSAHIISDCHLYPTRRLSDACWSKNTLSTVQLVAVLGRMESNDCWYTVQRILEEHPSGPLHPPCKIISGYILFKISLSLFSVVTQMQRWSTLARGSSSASLLPSSCWSSPGCGCTFYSLAASEYTLQN